MKLPVTEDQAKELPLRNRRTEEGVKAAEKPYTWLTIRRKRNSLRITDSEPGSGKQIHSSGASW